MFCTCTRPCACANDAKIMRSRDSQFCNTKELPLMLIFQVNLTRIEAVQITILGHIPHVQIDIFSILARQDQ